MLDAIKGRLIKSIKPASDSTVQKKEYVEFNQPDV